MHRLRQQQPKLHRELCNIAFRLQRVRDALVDLPEAYVLDGAMSEILMLTDHAVKEARDSLSVPGRRRPHCLTSSVLISTRSDSYPVFRLSVRSNYEIDFSRQIRLPSSNVAIGVRPQHILP